MLRYLTKTVLKKIHCNCWISRVIPQEKCDDPKGLLECWWIGRKIVSLCRDWRNKADWRTINISNNQNWRIYCWNYLLIDKLTFTKINVAQWQESRVEVWKITCCNQKTTKNPKMPLDGVTIKQIIFVLKNETNQNETNYNLS